MLTKFLVFGLIGICIQLVVSAAKRTVESRSLELTGEASIVLIPMYGLAGIVYPIIALHLGGFAWYIRGIIYMVIFYLFQIVFGFILTKLRLCPWNYSGKWNYNGLIRLADAPVWFLCGLAIEWVYPYARAVSQAF